MSPIAIVATVFIMVLVVQQPVKSAHAVSKFADSLVVFTDSLGDGSNP